MNSVLNRRPGEIEGDFVVFMIGMRINPPWRMGMWLPVVLTTPRMLRELARHPGLGLLGGQVAGTTLIQYWRSVEHLNAYAQSRNHAHLPAWRAFNRNARQANGAVGIWYEPYRVAAGQYETVYVNMPAYGVGKAGTLIGASGRRATAAGRIARQPGGTDQSGHT